MSKIVSLSLAVYPHKPVTLKAQRFWKACRLGLTGFFFYRPGRNTCLESCRKSVLPQHTAFLTVKGTDRGGFPCLSQSFTPG